MGHVSPSSILQSAMSTAKDGQQVYFAITDDPSSPRASFACSQCGGQGYGNTGGIVKHADDCPYKP